MFISRLTHVLFKTHTSSSKCLTLFKLRQRKRNCCTRKQSTQAGFVDWLRIIPQKLQIDEILIQLSSLNQDEIWNYGNLFITNYLNRKHSYELKEIARLKTNKISNVIPFGKPSMLEQQYPAIYDWLLNSQIIEYKNINHESGFVLRYLKYFATNGYSEYRITNKFVAPMPFIKHNQNLIILSYLFLYLKFIQTETFKENQSTVKINTKRQARKMAHYNATLDSIDKELKKKKTKRLIAKKSEWQEKKFRLQSCYRQRHTQNKQQIFACKTGGVVNEAIDLTMDNTSQILLEMQQLKQDDEGNNHRIDLTSSTQPVPIDIKEEEIED